jgi:hypothetical protein
MDDNVSFDWLIPIIRVSTFALCALLPAITCIQHYSCCWCLSWVQGGMLVAARAGAQMKMCPEPGQEYALAGAMQAAGYQYMKLSWAVDDTDGVNNRRRVLWLFQLPQVAAPPLGMFGDDVDNFSGWRAAPDNDDSNSPDADPSGSAESSLTQQQPTPATGSSSTATSAHRSGTGNKASASVSGH